jgi:cyclic pyranopterin phosphate synthase
MVDVTAKAATKRTAIAAGSLRTSAQVVELIAVRGLPAFWPPSAPAT